MKAKKRSPRCPYCHGVIRGHPSDGSHVCRLPKKVVAVAEACPPESPLISTLRYLIALDLPKAELLDRLVRAVRDANTTVDGRPLTAAEMRHEGEL